MKESIEEEIKSIQIEHHNVLSELDQSKDQIQALTQENSDMIKVIQEFEDS